MISSLFDFDFSFELKTPFFDTDLSTETVYFPARVKSNRRLSSRYVHVSSPGFNSQCPWTRAVGLILSQKV